MYRTMNCSNEKSTTWNDDGWWMMMSDRLFADDDLSSIDEVDRVLIYYYFLLKIFRFYDISQRFRLTGINCKLTFDKMQAKLQLRLWKSFYWFVHLIILGTAQREPFKFFYFPFLIGTRKSSLSWIVCFATFKPVREVICNL